MLNIKTIFNSLSTKEFKGFLLALDSKNDELFFELYNASPLKIKPQFKAESYFTDKFCSRIERIKDDKLFNYWFFSQGLSEFYGIKKLRELVKIRSNNQELSDYLETQDKPDSLKNLISTAFYYRKENPEKYKEIIKENKEKFESLNDRKFTQKSKIIETLFDFLKKETTQDVLAITKELNLDILKINSNSGTKFFHFEINQLSLKQIKEMYSGVLGENNIQVCDNFLSLFSHSKNGILKPYSLFFDILENTGDPEKYEKGTYIFEKIVNVSEEKLRVNDLKEKWNYIIENINTENKEIKDIVEYNSGRLRINILCIDGFLEKVQLLEKDIFACVYPVFSKLTKNLDENNNKKSNKPKI